MTRSAKKNPTKSSPSKSRKAKSPPAADASPLARVLPVLPLRLEVPFPDIVLPLVIHRDRGIRLVDDVMKTKEKSVALATQINPECEEPTGADLRSMVVIGNILKMLRFPDGTTRIVFQGEQRASLDKVVMTEPYLVGRLTPVADIDAGGVETDALVLTTRRLFERLMDLGGQISEEVQVAVLNCRQPGTLCDLLGNGVGFTLEEKQQLLLEPNVRRRLRLLNQLLRRQIEMHDLSSKIQTEASGELNRAQREQFLRQQLQAIRRELGESEEEEGGEIGEFYQRLERANLPELANREARRELDRIAQMHPSCPEYHVIRTFLDTLLSMPWHQSSEDRIDLRRAHRILDEDHYDLRKVKERILEFLAVQKLRQRNRGPILCFVGPPGVGKTSLGKSIARAMGRKFIRISLGGVHDEAEIRGHRRTYIGAMPGRIVQGIRKLGVNNPVFMLDEIDKLGRDYRGDPASAMLEVLDPEQNFSFRDHYLDVEFDLSRVLFVCTANVLSTIPTALRDRMEVIELAGYTLEEKIAIARKYLIPKQLAEHGLNGQAARFRTEALRLIIDQFTHEAGLRGLEREIAAVCRKIARQHAEGRTGFVDVTVERVHALLGPAKFLREGPIDNPQVGVAHGLAWTPVGGERLTIESIRMPGRDCKLQLTGSLGEVMKESAHAALGYLRSHAQELGIAPEFFEKYDLHIHIPAGAIAKDGPSGGVALFASLLSLATDRPIRSKLAMTGEITLTGRILAVGGIREKVLAARREGFDTVILPRANDRDLEELPKEVRRELRFLLVEHIDEAIGPLFATAAKKSPRRKPKPVPARRVAAVKPTQTGEKGTSRPSP